MKPGALDGIRVLDLSRVLAGPWASQMLGDLGADVVKVERPGSGDDTRAWGPPWCAGASPGAHGQSAYFTCVNRNKRSIALDMSQAEDLRTIRALAAKADIVLENFKAGGLKKYGLDYDSLSAGNPGLIYCSITGFGQTGPYAARAGYDFLIQGMGGLMSITGRADGDPGGGPIKVGVALVDILSGLYACNAILAALHHRQGSGKGQYIDIALLDVLVASLANQAANHLVGGTVPGRMGNAHPNIVPYQDFATADGHMILAVGNDGQFARFCAVAGHPEWANDDKYSSNAARVQNRSELVALISAVTRQRSTADWIAQLEPAGVPCGPINDIAQVFENPQVRHRGMVAELPDARGVKVPVVGSPMRLSASPVRYDRAPPELDQDGSTVLHDWLGRAN